jgi:hypothetical protein
MNLLDNQFAVHISDSSLIAFVSETAAHKAIASFRFKLISLRAIKEDD